MSKKKKRIKMKNKKKILLLSIIFLILIVLCTTTTIILINKHNEKIYKDIKTHYNKYVITTKKTTLYNKNHKELGTISSNYSLELKKYQLTDSSIQYFNIKDTEYYIYYKDIKKDKSIKKEEKNNNYIVFNKNIKTNKKINLYKDKKVVLTLNNGINYPIEYMDENNYYIYYLNSILKVKKDKSIKEIKKDNSKEKEAENISVLFYEDIEDNCNNYNCITTNQLKEQITKLLENNYYTITTDEYEDYLNGFIRLKEKAILLTTNNENDIVKNINKEFKISIEKPKDDSNLKYTSTNKTTNKNTKKSSIDRYQIKSYTTLDNLIKMAQGEEVVEQAPVIQNNSNGQGIAVLNYHFFYDSSKGESCNEGICLEVYKFREHLDYLKKNNYKVLTMNEFKRWMYGEIELPEKSVLITIDDGAMGTGKHNGNKLIPLLEEYKMPATLFLIAGWWDISNYQSKYLTVQSHTFDMHQYGSCGRGQINCATYEEAKADLKKSLDIIGNNDSFCFPFYYYSDTSIQAVKDSGFKLAFVGGNRKATRNNNKYLIPRYPIHSDITLDRFISIVS